ncbi:hypothetical protein [Mesorhizobium sp. A623]
MRKLVAIAIASVLALTSVVFAQPVDPQLPPIAPQTPQTPPESSPDQGFSDQNFTSVAVVAIEDLPPEIRSQVEAVINQTSAEDLQVLQSSIDASPQAASALAMSGLNSSQVVAVNIDENGTLTLIIQATA